MNSNGRFIYQGLNSDLNANRRTFKAEKKAYETDQVITSETDFETANDLYDKIINQVQQLITLNSELGFNVNTEGDADGELDYNRDIVARQFSRIDLLALDLIKNLKQLLVIKNNLNKTQIDELNSQIDLLENTSRDTATELGYILAGIESDNEQGKITKLYNTYISRIEQAIEILKQIDTGYTPIAVPSNPQSISGGYMLRPYMSNHKFI